MKLYDPFSLRFVYLIFIVCFGCSDQWERIIWYSDDYSLRLSPFMIVNRSLNLSFEWFISNLTRSFRFRTDVSSLDLVNNDTKTHEQYFIFVLAIIKLVYKAERISSNRKKSMSFSLFHVFIIDWWTNSNSLSKLKQSP